MTQQPENQPDHEQAENLRVLLEQHWLHCRHIESERGWFMNVYAIITGGMITFASTTRTVELWLIFSLWAFTLLGFLLTRRWHQTFQYHQQQAEKTAQALGAKLQLSIPVARFQKPFTTKSLFSNFYASIFIVLSILLITTNLGKG